MEENEPVVNNQSILNTVKRSLGIVEEYEHFDSDLILSINAAFFNLEQLGVGPNGFVINDSQAKWTDYLEEDRSMEAVKTYVYIYCKLIFDPPPTSFTQEGFRKQLSEIEWRLNVKAEEKGEDKDE